MKFFCNELCAVINGKLTQDGYKKLSKYCKHILIRQNSGLDATAYKYGIEYYGYKKLALFDELILFNFTCFAPIFDLKPMFKKIKKKKCDWWGLYICTMNEPYIKGEHLPSFFVAYRKTLLKSPYFKKYWDTLKEIKTYNDSVLYHEQRQTPFFDAAGFKRDVAFDLKKYDINATKDYWPLSKADLLLKNEHFPFLKRRNFYIENGQTNTALIKNIIDFLKYETKYNIHLIEENILRTQDVDSLDSTKVSKIKRLKRKILYLLSLNKSKKEYYKRKIIQNINSHDFKKLLNGLF